MRSATSGRGLGVRMAPAATPEEEMERRRRPIAVPARMLRRVIP